MANPSVANPGLIAHVEQINQATSKPKAAKQLERIEEGLRKAFGEHDETIANSLRGF